MYYVDTRRWRHRIGGICPRELKIENRGVRPKNTKLGETAVKIPNQKTATFMMRLQFQYNSRYSSKLYSEVELYRYIFLIISFLLPWSSHVCYRSKLAR